MPLSSLQSLSTVFFGFHGFLLEEELICSFFLSLFLFSLCHRITKKTLLSPNSKRKKKIETPERQSRPWTASTSGTVRTRIFE